MDPLVLYGAGFVFLLLVMGAGIAAYITRTESSNQPPVEVEALVNAIDEALVVLDADDTVLTANVTFRSLFGADVVGDSVETVFAEYPAVLEALDGESRVTVPVTTGAETRKFEVRHMPVGKGIDTDQKRLALFVDVTDQREHQRRLEQQNERLEEFASIISHDLRNPLDVAIGRTNAVKERLSDEELEPHLDRAQDAHGRMQRIITDVLSLAREGDRIDTTEPVPLDEVARDAWAHVDTEAASLDIETTLAVQADEEALTRAFENLFRNAIEHGSSGPDHARRDAGEHGSASPDSQTRRDAAEHGANADAHTRAAESPSARSARRDGSGHRPPVTVRVGELADDSGFFVADDGPGIPEDEREAVFEAGNGDGTGLGLAIVDRIATAHGWGVGVTDADDGGARFEFSGVELVSEERTAREA